MLKLGLQMSSLCEVMPDIPTSNSLEEKKNLYSDMFVLYTGVQTLPEYLLLLQLSS